MNADRLPTNAGLSLIEVLIAVSILSVGLVTVTMALRSCLAGGSEAARRAEATQIGACELDRYAAAVRHGTVAESEGSQVGPTGRRYAWTIERTPIVEPQDGLPGVFRVDIAVGWGDGEAGRSLALWTEVLGGAKLGDGEPPDRIGSRAPGAMHAQATGLRGASR